MDNYAYNSRVTNKSSIAKSPQALSRNTETLGKTKTKTITHTIDRIINDSEEKVLRQNQEYNQNCVNSIADNWRFIPFIPQIMENKSWKLGAKYQRLWQNGQANQLQGEASNGEGTNGRLHIESIDLDWVLKFKRSKNLFSEIIKSEVFANEEARTLIQCRINNKFKDNQLEISFGNFNLSDLALENEYVNYRGLSQYDAYVETSNHTYILDALTAALGRFAFYVIPKGIAKLENEIVTVKINQLGVYLRDSFDFNGFQPLGSWKMPDQVRADIANIDDNFSYPPTYSPEYDKIKNRRCFDTSWFFISNNHFRTFRSETGKGMDFLIYSNVKKVELSQPFEFSYLKNNSN